jgi:type III effector protein XopD
VADILGAGRPWTTPITQQHDGYSCGDHVLHGIELLAGRVAERGSADAVNMDLRMVNPNRDYILDVLTRVEQFGAESGVATASRQENQTQQGRGS